VYSAFIGQQRKKIDFLNDLKDSCKLLKISPFFCPLFLEEERSSLGPVLKPFCIVLVSHFVLVSYFGFTLSSPFLALVIVALSASFLRGAFFLEL
jgi:hypothetical protein